MRKKQFAMGVAWVGVGLASALLVMQQQNRTRELEQQLSKVLGDAKAVSSKRDILEKNQQETINQLTDVNEQLAQQVAHQTPGHVLTTPQVPIAAPTAPQPKAVPTPQQETKPNSSNNPSLHQTKNAPQLTVTNGLQDRDLTISIVGPFRLTVVIAKGQSRTIPLAPGKFVVKASAKDMPSDQSTLQVESNTHYSLSFSLKSSEVVSKKP